MSRLDTVDLRLLRVFATVVETRGFTAAQTVLNVTASTISNQIGALETRLGVKLCQRGRAGFKLTEDGEQVFSEAQKLFAAIDSFDLRASALRAHIRSNLVIGLVDNTITDPNAKIATLLRQFAASVRDVQIAIVVKAPNELLRDVLDEKIHVAIGSFPKILLGLTYRKIYDETHFFYCGARHPLFDLPAEQITLDLVSRQRLISRGYWGSRDTKHISNGRSSATVNNMEAGAQLILSGEYLGYLPAHYAAAWVARGEMRQLMHHELTYAAPFELVYGVAVERLNAAQAFVKQALSLFVRETEHSPGPNAEKA
jgi:DNA-binding transcriptional LysR family regulator